MQCSPRVQVAEPPLAACQSLQAMLVARHVQVQRPSCCRSRAFCMGLVQPVIVMIHDPASMPQKTTGTCHDATTI